MENSVKKQVIIIGAGPAGLCLAYHLAKGGVDYLMLEQNHTAGSSWAQMPDHLSLISLWHSNCLLKEDLSLSDPMKAHPAGEFAAYLKDFFQKHDLKATFGCRVDEIKKADSGFNLQTSKGEFHSTFVVDCRGYFNFPFTPKYPISGSPPKMIHFKDYKNIKDIEGLKKILIVGKRLSAGQLLRELSSSGKHEIFLSVRSPIQYSSKPAIYNFFLRNLGIIEKIIKTLKIKTKDEIEVPMEYGAKKIVEEKVTVKGDILKITDKLVTFKDQSSETIDAIIFTTGFSPIVEPLQNDFESAKTPGLFYLGRSGQRSFTSRFLRGIREDAPVLSRLIADRLSLNIKL